MSTIFLFNVSTHTCIANIHVVLKERFSLVSHHCYSLHWVNDLPKALSEVSSMFHCSSVHHVYCGWHMYMHTYVNCGFSACAYIGVASAEE